MSQSKQAAKSVFIIIIFTIGSKILGFIREALIAAKFGSGATTDTFFIALAATSLFTAMVTSAINTTSIPVLSEIENIEGKEGKNEHTNNLLNIVMVLSILIIALAWFLTPFILKILAYGFEGEQFELAVSMTRIGLFSIFFAGIVGVFRGYLQSELKFTESAASQLPFNFVYIFFLIFLTGVFDIKGLMVASVLAVAAQITIQVPGVLKSGFKYRLILDVKDKYIQKILILVPPILLSVVIGDINSVIDKALASTLVEGSISALNYASRINALVISIFITAIITVIFPIFSKEVNKKSLNGLKKIIINGINIILLITIPATVGLIILANPIIKVAFQRGAFDANATYMTSGALTFYTLGLVGIGSSLLLQRVYYSLQDMKTPMVNGLIAVGINITFNLILIRFMAHKGLALATSISATTTAGLLLYGLRKKIGPFGFLKSIKCGFKSLAASVAMGIIVYFLYNAFEGIIGSSDIYEAVNLFASAGVGALIYFILIYLLRIEEVNWFIKIVKNRLSIKPKAV
ncbi:MAG: murein biosynthesis integral membrane protein MurJ [Bacteroidales bacterium]|nr:murein biosynthesis integral membrane protein MurJ [Bacteroidales bacterium]